MKTRYGFVSNSSSASFIVEWRGNFEEANKDLRSALAYLFDQFEIDEKEGCWVPDLNFESNISDDLTDRLGLECIYEDLIKNTKTKDDGIFITTATTIMKNTLADFPNYIAYLIMALKYEGPNFEIIKMKVVDTS